MMSISQSCLTTLSAICIVVSIASCGSARRGMGDQKTAESKLSSSLRSDQDSLAYLIKDFELKYQHFCGFMLYDSDAEEVLIKYHEDKHFTPASNLKLFTLLASLKILGDSIPALAYYEQGDSLLIRGTGDPGFMTKNDVDSVAYHFLRDQDQDIYFDDSNFKSERFGSGWAWDDYPYDYQKELSPMPIYGNGTLITVDSASRSYQVYPYQNVLLFKADLFARRFARREEQNNWIHINENRLPRYDVVIDIPSVMEDSFFYDQLSHAVSQPIYQTDSDSVDSLFETIYHTQGDSLYKDLMLRSDNFVAEQLLLMCSHEQLGHLSTSSVIKHILQDELSEITDDIRWADGSGLSRYSLITPWSAVQVLSELSSILTAEQIAEWFPSDDHDDTLPSQMKGLSICAKTGTLSNNFNLSGYITTDSGRRLTFSFLNNHFMYPKADIATGMAEILSFIHRHY